MHGPYAAAFASATSDTCPYSHAMYNHANTM